MLIETGKIREYALATAATAPEYFTSSRAPVPPTFLSTVVFWEDLTAVFDLPEAREAFAAAEIEPDIGRLLSLQQEYEFRGDYPRAGDELATTVRFDGSELKQGRSGGMLLLRFAIDFVRDGDVVCVARYTSAYLENAAGDTPDDGRRNPAEPAGGRLDERIFGPVTMTDIVRYQGASGDFNPMHHDDEMARAAGYPAAFSVGMLGAAQLATYCVDRFGVESVRRFRARFKGLVFRGETLVARGWVSGAGAGRQVTLALVNDQGTAVVEADVDLV